MIILDPKKLYEIILSLDVVPAKILDDAFRLSQVDNKPFDQILLEKELLSAENLGSIVADLIKVPFVNLDNTSINREILLTVPELVAKAQGVVVFDKDQNGLKIAMADPSNVKFLEFLHKKTGDPIQVFYSPLIKIQRAWVAYSEDVGKAFNQLIFEQIQKVQSSTSKQFADPPIIKIVDTIIKYAYDNMASDIHLEPSDDYSLVRFRIDGVMHDVVKLPENLYHQVVTRIKVLARIRTDEHQAAQDGKIVYPLEQEELDLRVSVVPVTDGEKIVMRLLSEKSRRFSLTDLGFGATDMKKITDSYRQPHGMILSTGPTGSGKTTTLYALLKLLNTRDVNIMTIEDPVEYDMQGINQIPVNPKTDLTFAKGLRSIVRQDPDIILVGEIRDEETAGIAINAALTGHLVLSTLHTNDAATAVPRLLDMKIEPFLVGSTLSIVVGQRLVRKICQSCRVSKDVTKEQIFKLLPAEEVENFFGDKTSVRFYHGKGCEVCHGSGYMGRIGLFEVMQMTDQIREAVVSRKDAAEIAKIAVSQGMTTMLWDGLTKVTEGQTTIDEVMRVVGIE